MFALEVRRKYDAHLILAGARPWKPTAWKRVAAALEPVFGPPAKTAVRTNQKLGSEKPTDGTASHVLFAVALDAAVHPAAKANLSAFVQALDPVQRFTARRAWARACGGGAFESSLQDFLLTLERDQKTSRLRVPAAWKRVR